jgi:hypothetical protein
LPKLEHTNVIMNKSDIDAAIAAAGGLGSALVVARSGA